MAYDTICRIVSQYVRQTLYVFGLIGRCMWSTWGTLTMVCLMVPIYIHVSHARRIKDKSHLAEKTSDKCDQQHLTLKLAELSTNNSKQRMWSCIFDTHMYFNVF